MSLDCRDFLKAVPAIAWTAAHASELSFPEAESTPSPRVCLESFDYTGVKLRPSRWQKQYDDARNYYFDVSNDDSA
jgi:hypothetical protein